LFHLGALRRLNELGILQQVTTITGVSGGSMMAAHLAARLRPWPAAPVADWEARVAQPFRAFTSENLSTGPILRGWLVPWYYVWRWRNKAIEEVAARIEERLTGLTLSDLPDRHEGPRFVFCSVDLVKSAPYLFDRENELSWSIGRAVAASSCFPGYFRPFIQKVPRRLALVDGGLDDSRAVEPVWKSHETILVSDAGDTLKPSWRRSFFWLFRTAFVLWDQGQAVRKRWLLSNFELGAAGADGAMTGTYWGIDSSPFSYPPAPRVGEGNPEKIEVQGYSKALACSTIASVRTTYDAFSLVEAAVLENHGYFLADAAARAHVPQLIREEPKARPPHPTWMCERKVEEALRGSARTLPPRY